MPTWDWAESEGSQLSDEPRVRAVSFGDGYTQRSPDGINNMPAKWSLVYRDVSKAAGDEMIAFLRARGGWDPITWTPPRETVAKLWIAKSWSRSLPDDTGISTVQVVFEQDFSL